MKDKHGNYVNVRRETCEEDITCRKCGATMFSMVQEREDIRGEDVSSKGSCKLAQQLMDWDDLTEACREAIDPTIVESAYNEKIICGECGTEMDEKDTWTRTDWNDWLSKEMPNLKSSGGGKKI